MADRPVDDPEWKSVLADQVRHNGGLFFRLAYGVLRNRDAARDACQQAMLKACEHHQSFMDAGKIRSWLARVVVNESLLMRRRGGIEERVLARHGSTKSASMSMIEPGNGEMRESVLAALEQLPEDIRFVVALRKMEGLSGNEVKDLLGCSAGEVSKQLHRGLELLRGLLSTGG